VSELLLHKLGWKLHWLRADLHLLFSCLRADPFLALACATIRSNQTAKHKPQKQQAAQGTPASKPGQANNNNQQLPEHNSNTFTVAGGRAILPEQTARDKARWTLI
jgi:hypothetical protein